MITKIVKQAEGRYLLNDAVIISNINTVDDDIVYDFKYDKELLTEQESIKMCQEFILESILEYIEGEER